jgi:predicted RNase H-like HicB family nuclease
MNSKYGMFIQWSEEDDAFIVSFPDLLGPDRPCTHGSAYEEAAKNGAEVLELLVEAMKAEGQTSPAPGRIAASS